MKTGLEVELIKLHQTNTEEKLKLTELADESKRVSALDIALYIALEIAGAAARIAAGILAIIGIVSMGIAAISFLVSFFFPPALAVATIAFGISNLIAVCLGGVILGFQLSGCNIMDPKNETMIKSEALSQNLWVNN